MLSVKWLTPCTPACGAMTSMPTVECLEAARRVLGLTLRSLLLKKVTLW